jgi:hypothetical protein
VFQADFAQIMPVASTIVHSPTAIFAAAAARSSHHPSRFSRNPTLATNTTRQARNVLMADGR